MNVVVEKKSQESLRECARATTHCTGKDAPPEVGDGGERGWSLRPPACLAPRQCVNIIAHSLSPLSLSFLPSPSSERGILGWSGPQRDARARSLTHPGWQRGERTNEQTTFLVLLFRPSNHPTIPGGGGQRRNGQRADGRTGLFRFYHH